MRSTPHLAKILAHDAFLWEYSKRYKKSSDTHTLGPDFVQRERVHLQKYRASRAERNGKGRQETRVTAPTAGAAPLTRERVMALGREAGQRVDDGVADATASMKGLCFADIDRMDEDDRPAPPASHSSNTCTRAQASTQPSPCTATATRSSRTPSADPAWP